MQTVRSPPPRTAIGTCVAMVFTRQHGCHAMEDRTSDGTAPEPNDDEETGLESTAPKVNGTTTRARGPRVLLVDGEPMLRALTSRLLSRQGAEVTMAALPCDAAFAAAAAGVDVVVLDLDLPGATRLMERLAEIDAPPRRLVACATRALSAAEREACTTVLLKPFDFDALSLAVLGRAPRHRERRRRRGTPTRHTLRTRRRAARARLDPSARSCGDRTR